MQNCQSPAASLTDKVSGDIERVSQLVSGSPAGTDVKFPFSRREFQQDLSEGLYIKYRPEFPAASVQAGEPLSSCKRSGQEPETLSVRLAAYESGCFKQ